jgi:SAM-dependent methyltransferase
MDEAAVAALRDLYSDLQIDGRVLDLGQAGIHHFEYPPDALIEFDGDPASLPFADAEFDDVIVHGAIAADAFAEIARVLKPGGHFVCTFAGGADDAGRVKRLRKWFAAEPGFGGAESDLRTSLSGAGDRLWAVWAPKQRQ